MIGVIIVAHGSLGQEFLNVLERVVGKQENLAALCVNWEEDMEDTRGRLAALIDEVETGKGVLLLTDMFGGTPSNLAISFLGAYENLEVIAGVNMPMLVKLAKVRSTHTLEEASLAAQEAARSYINVASRLLGTGS